MYWILLAPALLVLGLMYVTGWASGYRAGQHAGRRQVLREWAKQEAVRP